MNYPISITLSPTTKCRSKCKTCNIWKTPGIDLEIEIIEKFLADLKRTPIWFTITGGEPFLRNDLPKIVSLIVKYCKPRFLNIATSGVVPDALEELLPKIVLECGNTKLKVNLSIDAFGNDYEFIRGVPRFDSVLKSADIIKKNAKADLGVNIVLSKYNINNFEKIFHYVEKEVKPDSIVSEIATPRKAFSLKETDLPALEYVEIQRCIEFLKKQKRRGKSFSSRLTSYLRKKYYNDILQLYRGDTNWNCQAAKQSIEVLANGDIISCCERGLVMGNLYKDDFKQIWNSVKSDEVRETIREGCSCTAVNPYYTSRLSFLHYFPF